MTDPKPGLTPVHSAVVPPFERAALALSKMDEALAALRARHHAKPDAGRHCEPTRRDTR